MGRNLYNLLIVQQTNSGSIFPAPSMANKLETDNQGVDGHVNWVGRFSHGTTFYFLGGTEGTEFTKNFKLPNPIKLADKLKKKLLSEAPTPDWEMLDDDAWKIEDEPGDGKSPVKDDALVEDKNSPRRGTNGWMKVKNR